MCQITDQYILRLSLHCYLTPLPGGDSWKAEPGREGPVPLCEWWLERQWRRQVQASWTAGAPSERPHLSELRHHPARTQQRNGPCKTTQMPTYLSLETTELEAALIDGKSELNWIWINVVLVFSVRCFLSNGWMLPMITSFKYMTTFSTQTGKTTLTQNVRSI